MNISENRLAASSSASSFLRELSLQLCDGAGSSGFCESDHFSPNCCAIGGQFPTPAVQQAVSFF